LDTSQQSIPFLVYGPLRAGTTMLRLMLNNHPMLANVGEFDYLFSAVSFGPDGPVIDTHLLRHRFGFQHFGLRIDESLRGLAIIEDLLAQVAARKEGVRSINVHHGIDHVLKVMPHARVVKLQRDPRDVACSSVQIGFSGNSYHGVSQWIETEEAWDRARATLSPDRYIELRFEDLVADPETELGRVCAFMGVPYDPAMLHYADQSTYERPDASIAFKWKTKMPPEEAARITSRAPALIASRGYEVPPDLKPVSATERFRLDWANRLGKWRFQIRHFGFTTFCMEKVTDKLRLRKLHGHIMDKRINPVIATLVK